MPPIPWAGIVGVFYFAMCVLAYLYGLADIRTVFGPFIFWALHCRMLVKYFTMDKMLAPLLMLCGMILTFSIVRDAVSPEVSSVTGPDYFKIIPVLPALVFLFFFGSRLRRIDFIYIATILYGLAFIASQVFAGSPASIYIPDALAGPAVLILDVFIFSLTGDAIFKYTKLLIRGRLKFLITVLGTALLAAFSQIFVKEFCRLNPNLLPLFIFCFL